MSSQRESIRNKSQKQNKKNDLHVVIYFEEDKS